MIAYRRFSSWLAVLIVFLTTTGCYDRQELEQQAFVTVLGIDKAPSGLIDCTLRIATPINSATGGGGGGGSEPLAATSPVTVRADSVQQALTLANSSIERTITMSHLTLVIFGEKLAKAGLRPYLEALTREPQFRQTVFLSVAKGSAREIMQSDKPMLEKSSGRTADSIYVVGNRVGLFPVVQMHDLMAHLEEPHVDSVLSVYAVNKPVASDPKGQGQIEQTTVSTDPGDTPRQGGNPVEWTGGAVFRKDKLVDYLSGKEVMYLRLLTGSIKTTRVDFHLPASQTGSGSTPDRSIGLFLREEQKPNISIAADSPFRVDIQLPLDAALIADSLPSHTMLTSSSKIAQSINRQIESDMTSLLKRLYEKDGVDPIPLSDQIRGRFGTYQAFADYPWQERLKSAKFHVTVQIDIRRTGQRT